MSGEWAVAGYRHVRELGRGRAGRVVLAVRESTGTPVAIRYLPPRPAAAPGFGSEARRIAAIDAPGLVRLEEFAESPQGAALVSELVNGISLERLIRAEGRLAAEAALTVLKATLLALGAAHRAGVVHGAVGPGDVLVAGDGSSKLAGLGVGAWPGAPGAAPDGYRAPELWRGERPDTATDLF
ncbi:MAG TPA: protein kinase, partial [Thermomonospora sp.]|nr:protein kinase [Thermomonospora sp.]